MEIVAVATKIALEEGIEKITVRAVAKLLGVQPGLISHYFPATEDLVVEALTLAFSQERERWINEDGNALIRMAEVIRRADHEHAVAQARLWLNARNYSRFSPRIADELSRQEALDRDKLTKLIEAGIAQGHFRISDAEFACIRILIAVDGVGAYANSTQQFPHEAYIYFVVDVAETELGIERGRLRAAFDALPTSSMAQCDDLDTNVSS